MAQKVLDQTYYEILEVSPDAPAHEIQRAYQRAKKTYSPDSPALYTMFTEEEARALLALIDEAFNTLSNQALRQQYDLSLQRRASAPATSSAHQSLPDFDVPHAENSAELSGPAMSSTSAQLPEGYARTRFTIYEINPEIEEQIKNQTEIDGAFLQKVRLYKKINLDQMSNETRISRPYLIAIEANDYASLPAPVFVRGFIVQIARVLGLKEQQAASSYMECYKKGKGG